MEKKSGYSPMENIIRKRACMTREFSKRAMQFFPVVFVFYEIINYLANDAYLPALPGIVKNLSTTDYLVQLTLTMFFLGNATMQLVLGPISDRFGRRLLLLCGGIVFIVSTLICAITHSIFLLLVARFFQGSAVTSMIIAGYATIHSIYDQTKAIKTLSWMNSVTILAPAFGPLLGTMILKFANWRWIFLILLLGAVFGLILLFFFMPETSEKNSSLEPKKVFKEYSKVLMNTEFIKPILAISLLFATMISWIAVGPFLIMERLHYSSLVFSLSQALIFGMFILGTLFTRRVVDRISLDRLVKICLTLITVGGITSFIFLGIQENLYTIVATMLFFAAGSGVGMPVFNRLAIESSQASMGIKMALFTSFMGLSGFFSSIFVGYLYQQVNFSFLTVLIMFTIGLCPFYFYKNKISCQEYELS